MVLENGKIEYFQDYLKGLDVFLYKESLNLTTGEYASIVFEMELVRNYIEYLKK